jgi:hypothetical protein
LLTAKIRFLRTEQEFYDKYGAVIANQVNERLPLIKETVEFLTRMREKYKERAVTTYISLLGCKDENGFSLFDIGIEVHDKLMFSLTNNGSGEMLLDIDGFPCWNEKDDEEMWANLEKREKEREKNQETPRPGPPGQSYSISRLEP